MLPSGMSHPMYAPFRDELRSALDSTTAQLIAASEKARRLQAACSVKEEVAKVGSTSDLAIIASCLQI